MLGLGDAVTLRRLRKSNQFFSYYFIKLEWEKYKPVLGQCLDFSALSKNTPYFLCKAPTIACAILKACLKY